MSNNFITNNKQQKTLKGRLNTLISISNELKFLVGFFYFNGWAEIYQSLQKNTQQKLKLLVGLQVCNYLGNIIEYAGQKENGTSLDEEFQKYLVSLGFAFNNEEMDTEEFYNQVGFFVQMIKEERLEIRKTENPNHAKLYLFQYNEEYVHNLAKEGEFITGSSNLTKSGLINQEEFNVEISDYGYENAIQYFDELWERAIPITGHLENRKILIDFIKNKTQVATVTPFEAYCLIIKTYLDLQNQQSEQVDLDVLLDKIGLKKFTYQSDAVNQAIQIIKEHNGCIIADVVGLGKSVIASMIARQINKRGIVICPPGLMGDAEKKDSGWWWYLEKFGLHNWQVYSRGIIDRISDNIEGRDFEVVIVDEAHYFRNQDTSDYEALSIICRDKQVILLSATPFNNSPEDIFSLLKLFIIPGKSSISLEDNLTRRFRKLNYEYKQLSFLFKNWNSNDKKKRKDAEDIYINIIDDNLPIDIGKVRAQTQRLSNEIKRIISPVVIRRNRLDLKQDYVYSKEVGELSVVENPKEIFYYLNAGQNTFYDEIISKYFSNDGVFNGAIYQPFRYEKVIDETKLDEFGNRQFNQQRNLYDFMRRILVKRFESSFGSFEKSIERFLEVHKMVRTFINKTGKFILDRSFIERIKDWDLENIERNLQDYGNGDLKRKTLKNTEVYEINSFQRKEEFLQDIDSDIRLFEMISERLRTLKLVEHDPKLEEIIKVFKGLLSEDPERKIILFSEYVDTIKHLEKRFRKEFWGSVLVCDGKVSKELAKQLNSDFNAQYKGSLTNHFKILLTSDKLSEGFNLNRAGIIINYDIPWNPTRVIQRVGRINRIGAKVFDKLFIYNFFPTLRGADIVKSREIAQQKMFLIHNALGEDAKIFDADEEPTPSALSTRINQGPEENGEASTLTKIRNLYADIEQTYPQTIERIKDLPARVKTAKESPVYQLNVLRRKGLSLFAQTVGKGDNKLVTEIDFEELLKYVECEFNEPVLKLSPTFWSLYKEMKEYKPKYTTGRSEISLEEKAISNLKQSLKLLKQSNFENLAFIQTLIKDIKHYHTLPIASIRRLGGKELKDNEKSIKLFLDEITWLKRHLGEDYLEKTESKVKGKSKEIIIAVENNNLKDLFS